MAWRRLGDVEMARFHTNEQRTGLESLRRGGKKKKTQHICVGLHSFSPAAGRGHLSIKSEFAVTVSRPGNLVQRPQGAAEKTAGNSGSQNQSSWSRCQGSWRRWTPNAGLIK